MEKKKILWIILSLIFIVIFNTIFFVIGGFKHNSSVWISYGFIHFAYFMLLLTPILTRKGKRADIFGLSIYSISTTYFIITFIIGLIFILIAPESNVAALLIQLCTVGIYGIILLSNLIANERTADAEEKRQDEIAYVKNASMKLKVLLENTNPKTVNKSIEKVYDAVCSSPVKSHPNLAQLEISIMDSINILEDNIEAGNEDNAKSVANSMLKAVNERNAKLKSLN